MASQLRQVASVDFVPSQNNNRLDLPIDNVVRRTIIRLRGTLVVGTANGTLVEDAALNLLSNITLKVDGKVDLVHGLDFRMLCFMAEHYAGFLGSGVIANATSGNIGTYTINLVGVIDHELPGLRAFKHPQRKRTGFDARGRNSVVLSFDMAALSAAIVAGGGGGTVTDTLSVDVIQEEDLNPPEFPEGRQLRLLEQLRVSLTAAGQLSTGIDVRDGNLLRGVYLLARDNSVRSDDIIGNLQLRLKRGGVVLNPEDRDWEEIQAQNDADFGMAFRAGEAFVFLDRGQNSEDIEDLANTSEARIVPTVTTTPTATSELIAIVERITRPGALPPAGGK